jgi:UDP-2-acetamido-2,6-beta-L-arabino-hexul-4-ose reductase
VRILVTGAQGFIGSNFSLRVRSCTDHQVLGLGPGATRDQLADAVASADIVFHLAGVNRPKTVAAFQEGNAGFTRTLCESLAAAGRAAPLVFTSSIQAGLDNPYGASKRLAEETLLAHGAATGAPVKVLRLPNVFGKWSRPNYNSVVATFCHNIARGLPIEVRDPGAPLRLLYVDDLMEAFLELLEALPQGRDTGEPGPVYPTTVGEVAGILRSFPESRESLVAPPAGAGLVRALYSTYLSFLPAEQFAYQVPCYRDPRGEFAEMVKTPDRGQVSYFTADPGITRGEHYHHSKTEKFLVVRGTARFRFRQVRTGESLEVDVAGGEGRIVESIPGWAHSVQNVGGTELIVLLWANEVFDRRRPDTYPARVGA